MAVAGERAQRRRRARRRAARPRRARRRRRRGPPRRTPRRAREQLGDEPGLADARLTRHEGERRAAGGGVRQRVLELLHLGGAPDDPAARHARRHGDQYAARRSARRGCRRPRAMRASGARRLTMEGVPSGLVVVTMAMLARGGRAHIGRMEPISAPPTPYARARDPLRGASRGRGQARSAGGGRGRAAPRRPTRRRAPAAARRRRRSARTGRRRRGVAQRRGGDRAAVHEGDDDGAVRRRPESRRRACGRSARRDRVAARMAMVLEVLMGAWWP